MEDRKQITPLAKAAAGFSAAGWVVVWLPVFVDIQRMAGGSAGVSVGYFFWEVVLAAGSFWLSGIGCGIAALLQVRRGEFRGRWLARMGLFLGCLPFALFALWTILILLDVPTGIYSLPGNWR